METLRADQLACKIKKIIIFAKHPRARHVYLTIGWHNKADYDIYIFYLGLREKKRKNLSLFLSIKGVNGESFKVLCATKLCAVVGLKKKNNANFLVMQVLAPYF